MVRQAPPAWLRLCRSQGLYFREGLVAFPSFQEVQGLKHLCICQTTVGQGGNALYLLRGGFTHGKIFGIHPFEDRGMASYGRVPE